MTHPHIIVDSDDRFSIDPITRKIIPENPAKHMLIRNDHKSERYAFELPLYIEGHDMSKCDSIQIHYVNVSSNRIEKSIDIYEVDDPEVTDDKLSFTWLISGSATKYVGNLSFTIRFVCFDGESIAYDWHTDIFSSISISDSINNSEIIQEYGSDILEEWKQDLINSINQSVDNKLANINLNDESLFSLETLLDKANVVDNNDYVFTETFSISLTNKNAQCMKITCDSYYEGENRPYINYIIPNYFKSLDYEIESNTNYSIQEWRVPPMNPTNPTCIITVNIPEGSSLHVRDFHNVYDDTKYPYVSGVRLNSHFGLRIVDSYAQNIIPTWIMAAKCGYTSLITVPQLTKNGKIVCTHNESIKALAYKSDYTKLTEDKWIKDMRYGDIETYDSTKVYDIGDRVINTISGVTKYYRCNKNNTTGKWASSKWDEIDIMATDEINDQSLDLKNYSFGGLGYYKGERIPTIEEFFEVCSRTGMTPMFSAHRVSLPGDKLTWQSDAVYSKRQNSTELEYTSTTHTYTTNELFGASSPVSTEIGGTLKKDDGSEVGTNYKYKVSDFLPVTGGSTIIYTNLRVPYQGTFSYLCSYDSDKNFIEAVSAKSTNFHSDAYTVPNNAAYIRVGSAYAPSSNPVSVTVTSNYQTPITQGLAMVEGAGAHILPSNDRLGISWRCNKPMDETWTNVNNWIHVKRLLKKYNLLDKFHVKSFSSDVLLAAYKVFGNEIDGYTKDDFTSELLNYEPFKSAKCRVGFEGSKDWWLNSSNRNSHMAIINSKCFAAAYSFGDVTSDNKVTGKTYTDLIRMGVTEFTDDYNCNQGLIW